MNIGDKVVCVDDDFSHCWDDPKLHWPALPVKGRVYVIKSLSTALNGESGIQLVGLESYTKSGMFYPWRFRLLQELKAEASEKSTGHLSNAKMITNHESVYGTHPARN